MQGGSGSALRLRRGREALVRRACGLPAYDQQVGVGGLSRRNPRPLHRGLGNTPVSLETEESPRAALSDPPTEDRQLLHSLALRRLAASPGLRQKQESTPARTTTLTCSSTRLLPGPRCLQLTPKSGARYALRTLGLVVPCLSSR